VAPPGLRRINPRARAALQRHSQLAGAWAQRLAGASQKLISFINRFYGVTGFQRVVRDYYGGRYRRNVARLVMRYANRLANRYPDFARRLTFERVLGFSDDGQPIRTVAITRDGMRFRISPGPRISPFAIRSQFLRDMTLFGEPAAVRWVFDGRQLGMEKGDVVRFARRVLSNARFPSGRRATHQQWLDVLNRIIVVV
jgi:hypothetical protein